MLMKSLSFSSLLKDMFDGFEGIRAVFCNEERENMEENKKLHCIFKRFNPCKLLEIPQEHNVQFIGNL